MASWTITFTGDLETGNIRFHTTTDADVVPMGVVLRGVLACCAGDLSLQAISGLAVGSPPNLPDGWEATADGVNTTIQMESGRSAYSRNYRNGEVVIEAPCSGDGSPTYETVSVLATVEMGSTTTVDAEA